MNLAELFSKHLLPVIIGISVALLLIVFGIICLWKMFKKADGKGYKALIPFYRLYTLWKHGWGGNRFFHAFVAIFFGAYLVDIMPPYSIAWYIAKGSFYAAILFAFVYHVIMNVHLAHRFGKSTLFGIFLCGFFPIVGYAILAFSDADYVYNRDTAGEAASQFTNYRITPMKERRAMTGYFFILPFIIGFLMFMVKPLFLSLQMSFNEVKLVPGEGYTMTWKGFFNYHYAMASDPNYSKLLTDESGRMVINTIATLVLSFVVAVILNQKFKGRLLCRIIFFLPVILSSGVLPGIESSNEFYNMMSDIGNTVQNTSGINISQSLQSLLSVSGVAKEVFDVIFDMIDAIYDIVMASGIQIIVFLSGLQAISPSLYEAADVEGCSAWESFWKITFPMVSPLLLVNTIYTIIDFFMKNDNSVMERINTVMYGVQLNFGVASAMSWIYFLIALAFIGISSGIIALVVRIRE